MEATVYRNSPTGYLLEQTSLRTGQGYLAYVPHPLPRSLTALSLDDAAIHQVAEAEQALGRLDGILATLPRLFDNCNLLMAQIIYRREAVASTRIEGTRITDEQAQRYEAVGPDPDARTDYREVTNYIAALRAGQELLRELPISARYLCRLHEILLEGLPAQRAAGPHGCLRDHQVIIGGSEAIAEARFIPPPAELVPGLLDDWAAFAHAELPMPTTVQTALLHYQFETIHPFGDGNGRLGRLVTKLHLYARGVLRQPILYLSGYLLPNRGAYYDAMLAVSQRGAWSDWVAFLTRAIAEQARKTTQLAQDLVALYQEYLQRLEETSAPNSAYRLLDLLFEHQTVTTPMVAESLQISMPTARAAMARLVDLKVLTPQPGRERAAEHVPEGIVALLR